MLEKRFYAVPPQLFTSNGTTDGVVTIAANACVLFKVKQKVYLSATGLPDLYLEIKEIDSEENIQVGPIAGTLGVPGANTGITARTDISAYTVALGAAIFADEQKRPAIDNIEIVRATYQEEPTAAIRSIMVDDCGNTINDNNPFPVSLEGSISISDVTIVGPGGSPALDVNSDGSINVNIVNSTPTSTPGLTFLTNEITSVGSGIETTIITVTAPSDGYRIQSVDVSGDTIALYKIYVNGGTPIFYRRSWWTDFNLTFDFESFTNGLLLTSGQVLTVTAYQTSPFLGTFEATVTTLIN
jgi:hypothetical protein